MADEDIRRFALYHVTENGIEQFFSHTDKLDLMDAAVLLRMHLYDEYGLPFADLMDTALEISREEYQEGVLEYLENPGRVAGAYEVDLDRKQFSALSIKGGWIVYKTEDVSWAAKAATRIFCNSRDERWSRFMQRMKTAEHNAAPLEVELCAARPLVQSDFEPDGSIEEMDNHLNFYLAVNCNVDDLFGTNIEAVDNDDYLNVYANYDLDAGEVVGYLDITLCRGDGVDVPMRCRLSDDERAMLLTKMRDYCQQCGSPLDEWRAEYLAEREAEAASTVRKNTKQEGENKMSSREISLWIDERWADALEEHLPGHDLQKKMEELLNGLTEQLPEQVREDIRREIRAEDERMEREREAGRRFSALKVTEDGRDCFLISEDRMDLLNLAGCIRNYLSRDTGSSFASTLFRVRECDVAEFKTALAERADNTGRVVGVFMVDVDDQKVSTLDECGDWHEYKFHDLSVAAYAANRKTQQRQERRQEIFTEKLRGKDLTPVVETHSPAPMMGQTM